MGVLIASAVQRLRPSGELLVFRRFYSEDADDLSCTALASGLSANVKQMLQVLEAAGIDGDDLICRAASRLDQSCEHSKSTMESDSATSSLVSRNFYVRSSRRTSSSSTSIVSETCTRRAPRFTRRLSNELPHLRPPCPVCLGSRSGYTLVSLSS